jgi:hypothetical protein
MRAIGLLLLVGCAKQSGHPAVDAPPDPAEPMCTSAGGTANVVVRIPGSTKMYGRLYAGGFEGSLVNGFSGPPLALKLVFANDSPIPSDTGNCCGTPGSLCCGIDSIAVNIDNFPSGAEVGSHAANVFGMGFSATGTLTITDWIHPIDMPPGHIAGSLSVTTGNITIDGTFDNTFCDGMVGILI